MPTAVLPFPFGQSDVVLENAIYILNSSVDITTIVIQNNGLIEFVASMLILAFTAQL